MTPEQQMVAQFMREVAGQEFYTTPTLRTPEIHKLQFSLMREEAIELYAAEIDRDIGAIADAIGDLKYVVCNTANAHGLILRTNGASDCEIESRIGTCLRQYVKYCKSGALPEIKLYLDKLNEWCELKARLRHIPLSEVFAEIHRSNMTKLWTRAEINVASLQDGWTYRWIETSSRRCCRVKNELGKLIKSPSYSPANLKPILGIKE
jgi:predicted HAD superfamily Cof-like phosphohydrolase